MTDLIKLNQFLQEVEKMAEELKEARNSKNIDRVYTNDEFVKMMGISKRTAQTWRDEGKITFSQIGGKIYYSQSDIDTMLNENKKGGYYAA